MASSLSSLKVNDSSRIDQSPSTSSKFQLQFAHSPSRTEGACGSTRSVSSLHGWLFFSRSIKNLSSPMRLFVGMKFCRQWTLPCLKIVTIVADGK